MADPFIGEIRMMPYNFIQEGWFKCDGGIYPVGDYTALFSLVSDTFGGNGHTTFGVPDLRGRMPMHEGGTFTWGYWGGYNRITLTQQNLPPHSHNLQVASTDATSASPENDDPTKPSNKSFAVTTVNVYTPFTSDNDLQSMQTGALSVYGGNTAHNNMQPYQAIGFFIANDGLYPPRQ